jgi:hypothetical protein
MITNTSQNDPLVNFLIPIEVQEKRGQQELVRSSQLPAKGNPYGKVSAVEAYERLGINVIGPSKGDPIFLDVVLPEGWKKESTDHSMYTKLIDDRGRQRMTFFYKAAFYDREAFISTIERRFDFRVFENLSEEERGHYESRMVKVLIEDDGADYRVWADDPVVEEMMIDGSIYKRPIKRYRMEKQKEWIAKYKDWHEEKNNTPMYFEIYDCGKLIFRSQPTFFKNTYHEKFHMYWHKKYDTFKNRLRKEAIQYLDQHYPSWNDTVAYW